MSRQWPVSFLDDRSTAGDVRHLQQHDYFFNDDSDRDSLQYIGDARRRASMPVRMPPPISQLDMAFAALQYLPMPVIVLTSTKTVLLANEAMGRILGIGQQDDFVQVVTDGADLPVSIEPEVKSATDILYGVPFSQLGFDVLQGGSAVFVAWEDFLETIVDDAACTLCPASRFNRRRGMEREAAGKDGVINNNEFSPKHSTRFTYTATAKTEVHDAVVDVVLSTHRDPRTGLPQSSRHDVASHIQAQMIVSVWATDEDMYFTLTLTAAPDGGTGSLETAKPSSSRSASRVTTAFSSFASGLSSASSTTSSEWRGANSQALARTSGSQVRVVTPAIPPRPMNSIPKGPPTKMSAASAPTMFSKSNRLKDAILNSMAFPAYAMWKDESFGIPNKAAIKLIYPWIEDGVYDSNDQARDFLTKYRFYNEDFSAEISFEDFPVMRVMKERKAFTNYRVGMYSAKDGSKMLFDVNGEPILDNDGEFLGGLVVFHDVTDFTTIIARQQMENERQFEEICNMVPQMIWRALPDGKVEWFSDHWYSYTGLTVEQSCGHNWFQVVHPDDALVVAPIWKHSLATGNDYRVEYRFRSATGEWRWMLGRGIPMRDQQGNIENWFGSCTDIHDLVIAREEAKETRARLQNVIEHADITIWGTDIDQTLTFFEGKSMYRRNEVGYDPAPQIIGKHMADIFRLQGREGEMASYLSSIQRVMSGELKEETIEVQIAETSSWFRTRIMPLMRQQRIGGVDGDSFIDGVVGISMDITAYRKAEEEIRERNRENERLTAQSEAAKEASKMKSQFLANMSHEIRTPIAGVIGMSELLLDDDSGELTKDQRECAINIQRSANGLLTVINDILDFSKVESGRLDIEEVPFDLSVVIQDVNKLLSFAAERKGLQYKDEIQQLRDWKVVGDPGRLRQVMTNLLTNSIKFTSEGSVTLRVRIRKESREIVEVEFSVEDTGVGIEEEGQQKLFKPFAQADSSTARRFGGTGLGLTISKNLVELMHGEISLQSKLGVGTKATFWIPFNKVPYQVSQSGILNFGHISDRLQADLSVSRPDSERSERTTPPAPCTANGQCFTPDRGSGMIPAWPDEGLSEQLDKVDRSNFQVLVVEDNPINQQIAIKTVKKLGFPVKAVWNGKEAIDYLQQPSVDQPQPDIILMDVQMPIMDGYLATSTIRNSITFANNPAVRETPIVAMTASAIQGDREKCQRAGMDDYLAKPVKKTNLESMLVKWAIESRKRRFSIGEIFEPGAKLLQRPAGPREISSFVSCASSHIQSSEDHISSELDRLEIAEQAAAWQRTAESSSDVAIRNQQAEEKAILLRDGTLREAGDDPKYRLGRGLSEESFRSQDSAALTTENIKKHSQSDRMAMLRHSHGQDDDNSSVVATISETDPSSRKQSAITISTTGEKSLEDKPRSSILAARSDMEDENAVLL